MKITLTYTLPEDRDEMLCALYGQTYVAALLDLDTEMRSHLKYGAPLSIQELRDRLFEMLRHTPWRD